MILIGFVTGLKIGHVKWVTRHLEIFLLRSLLNLSERTVHWELGPLLTSFTAVLVPHVMFWGFLLDHRTQRNLQHWPQLYAEKCTSLQARVLCPSSAPYCVDDSHMFPAGFLNYRMTDFLICHITPDKLHCVAYGIFVCGYYCRKLQPSSALISYHQVTLYTKYENIESFTFYQKMDGFGWTSFSGISYLTYKMEKFSRIVWIFGDDRSKEIIHLAQCYGSFLCVFVLKWFHS